MNSMDSTAQIVRNWLRSALLPVAVMVMGGAIASNPIAAIAQTQATPTAPPTPNCQPPGNGEYLLIVVTRTPDSQTQVRQLLPASALSSVCTYLNDTVTRVGGFRTLDRANAWARYITDTTGWAAFVARPPKAATPTPAPTASTPSTAPTAATPAPTNSTLAYNPKPLAAGYAVLVDYAHQPEIATLVQQALGADLGLAVYSQRPYLLASYTTDANAAYATLQTLSDRGFLATLVDSRRVILLKPSITLPPNTP